MNKIILFRIQLAELCKDIVNEKEIQLNHDDERYYRQLTIDTLGPVKTFATSLNEFVCDAFLLFYQ